MLRALAVVIAVGVTAAPPSLERAVRVFGPAMAQIHVAGDGLARVGFFVSGSGVAVTVLPGDVDEVVVELPGGDRRKARVLVRDDDGLALVETARLTKDSTSPSLGLGQGVPPEPTAWVLGVGVVDGKPAPSVGGLRSVDGRGRWHLDLPLDAGAPVLMEDRVIAVVVERKGTTACQALPVERVLSLVKRIPG